MKLLSINSLRSFELTRFELYNIVAKGTKLDGGPDTDGEEDCMPPPPGSKDIKGKYCIDPPVTI